MKKINIYIILLAITLVTVGCSTAGNVSEEPDNITASETKEVIDKDKNEIVIITEDYAPLNYIKDDKVVGSSVDIVRTIKARLNLDSEILVQPWKRGYESLENNINTCLFSTVRTEEREDQFKWVGPLTEIRFSLYAKKSNEIVINQFEDAKEYSIGSQEDGWAKPLLIENDFPNVDYVSKPSQNLTKLEADRIDLWIASNVTFANLVNETPSIDINDFEEVYVISTSELYIAFNKETADDIVNSWQKTLDEMYDEGIVEDILNEYNLEGTYPESLKKD